MGGRHSSENLRSLFFVESAASRGQDEDDTDEFRKACLRQVAPHQRPDQVPHLPLRAARLRRCSLQGPAQRAVEVQMQRRLLAPTLCHWLLDLRHCGEGTRTIDAKTTRTIRP